MKLFSMAVGPVQANCYILVSENNNAAVIDPGGDAPRILAKLQSEGVTPKYILLTHGHFDHIGAANAIKEKYGAPILIGEKDAPMLTETDGFVAMMPNRKDYYVVHDRTVKEGDVILLDELSISVLESPGHTAGGVCYLCGDALFTGDSLFAGDIGRCDLPGGDYNTLLASVKRLSELPPETKVYPGHERASTIAAERRQNMYIVSPPQY